MGVSGLFVDCWRRTQRHALFRLYKYNVCGGVIVRRHALHTTQQQQMTTAAGGAATTIGTCAPSCSPQQKHATTIDCLMLTVSPLPCAPRELRRSSRVLRHHFICKAQPTPIGPTTASPLRRAAPLSFVRVTQSPVAIVLAPECGVLSGVAALRASSSPRP